MKKICIALILCALGCDSALPCTSMIVSSRKSATGTPLLWKHRDTDADNNFLARVEATDSTAAYVGLFNAGDSTLSEAWMGMNERGFAIMNTASYNVADLESDLADREAVVMTDALKHCTTVDDFERLLQRLPKPLGVQANFGVIDADGGAAYFETDDRRYVRFDVDSVADGYIIRTNFSVSGDPAKGRGHIRYNTASKIAAEYDKISPLDLTEGLSKQFYHSVMGRDLANDSIVYDADFIPRDISTASLVVVGTAPGEPTDGIAMWGCLGYPPCSVCEWVTLTDIPAEFGPGDAWRSEACDRAFAIRRNVQALDLPDGRKYLDMNRLRPAVFESRRLSHENYVKRSE